MTAVATPERAPAKATSRPSLYAAVVLAVGFVALYVACLARNDGRFVYCVDDAYIHLALAKNLALHGVYGVRPDEFAAASSSIAWPWLLAGATRLFGSAELVPLALGFASALGLGALVARVLGDAAPQRSPRTLLGGVLAVLFLAPVLPVVFVGMEHVPHALAVLALAYAGVTRATEPTHEERRGRSARVILGLGLLAALASSLRYETWFVAAPLVVLLAARRRAWEAFAVGAGAALPAAAYATFAHSHGAPWLPMSVVLKRAHVPLVALPGLAYQHLIENPHVLVVLVGLAWCWASRRRRAGLLGDRLQALLAIAFVALCGHVTLAQLGWFFRYEAYVLVLALTAVAAAALEGGASTARAARVYALALVIGTLPLTLRAVGAHRAVPLASGNIADQQLAVARFLDEAYPADAVAVNDIGAVSYVARSRVVDLMGLGNARVAAARHFHIDQGLGRADLQALVVRERFPVAVVYDDWFQGALPPTWTAVARWKIPDNRVCAKDTVTFYAVAPPDAPGGTPGAAAQDLRSKLDRFAPRIPPRVEVQSLARTRSEDGAP